MAEFPAFPLWTDAYLADTGHLSTTEHGAYLLLLITMWRAGGKLPNDDKKLARYAKCSASQWDRLKPILMDFFTVDGDDILQGRLSDELDFVRRRSIKQSENARSKSRKTKETAKATAKPNVSQTEAPTPTPTPNSKKEPSAPKKGKRIPDDFEPDLDAAVAAGLRPENALLQAAKFKNYWQAESGQKASKLDWNKTWINWYLSAIERQGGPRGSPGKSAFQQHQETARQSLEDALKGTEYDQSTRDTEQPAFDLDPADWRATGKTGAGK